MTASVAEGGAEGTFTFKELSMAESVYKVIELVGTSTTSWEKAASAAVTMASQSLRDLRIAEVSQLDMHIVEGKPVAYRARVKVSFKYTPGGEGPVSVEEAAPRARRAPKAKEEPASEDLPVAAPKRGAKKAKRRPAKG